MKTKSPFRKVTKTAIACTLGVTLLVGGSTYALWTSNAPADTQAAITTGDLKVTAASAQKWTDITKADAPFVIENLDDFRMSPGDTLRLKQDLNVVIVGDNISGVLDVRLPNDTVSQAVLSQAVFTLTVLDKDGKTVGSVTPTLNTADSLKLELPDLKQTAPTGEAYSIAVTVALPKTADNAVKNQVVLLNNTAITLRQGKVLASPTATPTPSVPTTSPTEPVVTPTPTPTVPVDTYPTANAASDFSWGGSATEATITKYNGTSTDVVIPKTYTIDGVTKPVTAIGGSAFTSKKLTSIVMPNSMRSIGAGAFRDNLLKTVDVPSSVTTIGQSAFYGNSLESVKLHSGLTTIGSVAFSTNKLSSLELPDTVVSLGTQAFAYNQISALTLPKNLTNITDYAFYSNRLNNVTVPASVTVIGTAAFAGNMSVASFTMLGNAPTIAAGSTVEGSFGEKANKTVYYKTGATGYTNPWRSYTTVKN
jgi:alternate signal-mediated exported protein